MIDEKQDRPQWGDGVLISSPRLYRITFARESEEEIPEAAEGRIEFKLNLERHAPLQLGIEFGVGIEDVPGIEANVLFRMTCTLAEGSPEAKDPETAFRQAAARLAPTVMYPYVREALASLAQKAQIPSFVLPIVNFGRVYQAESISVPPAVEQAKLALQG